MTWTSRDKCLVPGLGESSSDLADMLAEEGGKGWAAGGHVAWGGRQNREGRAMTAVSGACCSRLMV